MCWRHGNRGAREILRGLERVGRGDEDLAEPSVTRGRRRAPTHRLTRRSVDSSRRRRHGRRRGGGRRTAAATRGGARPGDSRRSDPDLQGRPGRGRAAGGVAPATSRAEPVCRTCRLSVRQRGNRGLDPLVARGAVIELARTGTIDASVRRGVNRSARASAGGGQLRRRCAAGPKRVLAARRWAIDDSSEGSCIGGGAASRFMERAGISTRCSWSAWATSQRSSGWAIGENLERRAE